MKFKDFFLEKLLDNATELVYVNPTKDELYRSVLPNILDGHPPGDYIGIIFTAKNVYIFDRSEITHNQVYYKYLRNNTSNTFPGILTRSIGYFKLYPAYTTFKERNIMGYNDYKKINGSQLKGFLNNGGYDDVKAYLRKHSKIDIFKPLKLIKDDEYRDVGG